MKLSEISYPRDDIKRLNYKSTVDLFLNKHGFKQIGTSMDSYAMVWSHPALNYVLKVFMSEDHCYPKFVELAQEKRNDHYPTFKGKLMRLTPEYYAIRMERLTLMPPGSSPKIISTARQIAEIREVIRRYCSEDTTNVKSFTADKIFDVYPTLKEACVNVYKARPTYHCRTDIHSRNIMFNRNIPVIIDPWAP